jgi:hypothetical protein
LLCDNGYLSYFAFDNFHRSQQFGDSSTQFPLIGTRDVFGPSGGTCPSAACGYHVTVQQSTFTPDGFVLQYQVVGTQVVTPLNINFIETISGTLDGDHLVVNYSMTGTDGIPANSTATGRLPRE